jgi:hypothetical protein
LRLNTSKYKKPTEQKGTEMKIIDLIIELLPETSKPVVKFVKTIIETIIAMPGKVNFRNMSRYCLLSEKTISRNFRRLIDFFRLNEVIVKRIFSKMGETILAIDTTFLSKSGKKTYGLGNFFNTVKNRSEKGIELCVVAVVSTALNTAFTMGAEQTPPIASQEKDSTERTRIDFYLECLLSVWSRIKGGIRYCVADGFFAKAKFVDGVLENGLHLISRLRIDADLKYIYKGEQKKRGRPRLYADKVDIENITGLDYCGEVDDGIFLYSDIVYSVSMYRQIRLVLLVNGNARNKNGFMLLFSTDVEQSAEQIYRFYKSRFQIEFIFRDAKQFTGLTDCQSPNQDALYFHFNISLSALNCAKAIAISEHDYNEPFVFSMASVKRVAFNELLMEKIFSKLDLDLTLLKFNPLYEELRFFGAIAA